jgi:hypothetical protein
MMMEDLIRAIVQEEIQKTLASLKPDPAVGEYLTPQKIEETYGITKGTLATMRCRGFGPPYVKAGRSISYNRSEFEDFIKTHRIRTGSRKG